MTVPFEDNPALRQKIIDACLWMTDANLNQGTSGNISVRVTDGILLTPSAIPYTAMTVDQICKIALEGEPVAGATPKPTTEWRFHQAVMQSRPDVMAVVHAHSPYATAIATQRKPIPAVHYMVAAFGGTDVPVADYALFGSEALSDAVVAVMQDRHGCLMANHGALAVGDTLDRALWRLQELETLAQVYTFAMSSGTPVILTDADIAETLKSFEGYGAG